MLYERFGYLYKQYRGDSGSREFGKNHLCDAGAEVSYGRGGTCGAGKAQGYLTDHTEGNEALQKFIEMVEAQGGDNSVIKDISKFEKASVVKEIISPYDGYITFMDTKECGIASCILGAGRETKEDSIDYSAGIVLKKKTGDRIEKGDVLAVMYGNKEEKMLPAEEQFLKALKVEGNKPETQKLIYARVTGDTVEWK